MKIVFFILMLIALAIAGLLLWQNISYRWLAENADKALGECIIKVIPLTIDCKNIECPEIDLEFLAFCESLPINLPAKEYIEVYVAPLIEVCTDYEYYFDNEVCIKWTLQ